MEQNKRTKIFPVSKMLLKREDQAETNSNQSIYFFAYAIIILFYLAILGRLMYLQLYKADEFAQKAQKNSIKKIRLQPYRGNILDRVGRLIAGIKPCFNVEVELKDVKNVEDLLKKLTPLLDEDPLKIRMRLVKAIRSQPRYMPIIIKRNASWEEVARVEARLNELPGVRIEVSSIRRYPHGVIAPHLLGYLREIDKKQLNTKRFSHAEIGDLVGKEGIEYQYEQVLAGKSGYKKIQINALSRLISVLEVKRPEPGKDLYLSIDLDLQLAAEEALSGKIGSVVALDPNSGKILAMASSPKYDPSIFLHKISTQKWKELQDKIYTPMLNKAYQGAYAPGSTFKIVMAAAALNEHLVNLHTSYYCGGSFKLGIRKFRCWKRGGHGQTNLYKALVQSCDVYFYNVGLKLGVDRISKYAYGFGFGKRTGIELPGENPGFVPTRPWKKRRFHKPWLKGDTINYSIGQGFLLVTPLQLARMMSAVANGGKIYRPEYLLNQAPELQGRVPVDPKYLKAIIPALKGVIEDKHGTAKTCRIQGLEIAGKTGTAQVVTQKKRGESEKMDWIYKDHALFVAFAPVKDPQIAVAVVIEHGGHGGSAAAPVARAVIDRWYKLQFPNPITIHQKTAKIENRHNG